MRHTDSEGRRADARFPRPVISLLVFVIVLPMVLPGCGGAGTEPTPTTTLPSAPTAAPAPAAPDYWPTTGWRTSTPEEQGVDSGQLLVALQHIENADINIRGLTVIRNGYIVLEAYNQPFTPTRQYPLFSVTKSVTGALVGIAVEEGYIKSIKEPLLSFFPEKTIANRDKDKEAITLEDMVSMQPGLDCNDDVLGRKMEASPDWVQFVLDLPMAEPPGTKLVYCTAGMHVLSAVLAKATGMSMQDYAQSRLFDPLGISKARVGWGADPQGITLGGYGLELQPRDMAKLGLLYLYGGRWEGKQVVPEQWTANSTRVHAKGGNDKDYGYGFWVYPSHFAAEGYGEQKVQVVRDREMVVAITAAIDWHKGQVTEDLLRKYIIPAAVSEKPLPANTTAFADLQAKVKWMADPVSDVQPLPEAARNASGKTYVLDKNDAGWKTIWLEFAEGSPEATAAAQGEGPEARVKVGMDNVYRLTTLPGEPLALRAHWDGNALVVRQLNLLNLQEIAMTFEFLPGEIKGRAREPNFGEFDFTLHGVEQK